MATCEQSGKTGTAGSPSAGRLIDHRRRRVGTETLTAPLDLPVEQDVADDHDPVHADTSMVRAFVPLTASSRLGRAPRLDEPLRAIIDR
jgi:hypothetical protein